MTIIGNLGYVAVCVLGSALAMSGEISFGVIVAFILYVRLFTSPLSTLAQGMTQMQTAAAAGDHVFDFSTRKSCPMRPASAPNSLLCRAKSNLNTSDSAIRIIRIRSSSRTSLPYSAGAEGGYCGSHRSGQDHDGQSADALL